LIAIAGGLLVVALMVANLEYSGQRRNGGRSYLGNEYVGSGPFMSDHSALGKNSSGSFGRSFSGGGSAGGSFDGGSSGGGGTTGSW
jgi:uncharacterized protein